VYRRRRLLAGGLLLLAVAAVLIFAQLIQAGIGGGPLPTTGAAATSAGPMIQAGARQYVVRPGDTVWSIANALDHGGDERPLVDALVKELHGATLYPGQVVTLPAGS
jgi:nucleoid-associated protein YgaU